MALVRKTGFMGNFSDRQLALQEQSSGSLQSPLDDKSMDRHTGRLPEGGFQVQDAHADVLRDLAKRKIPIEIVFNIRERLAKPLAAHAGVDGCVPVRQRTVAAYDGGCKSCAKAIEECAASRITSFHFGFERPADVLDLGIADLKAVHYLQAIWREFKVLRRGY
jgi:hypothetical protein